jgi:hypothetical protein
MVIVVYFYKMKKEATILNHACLHSKRKWATSFKVFMSDGSAAFYVDPPSPPPSASQACCRSDLWENETLLSPLPFIQRGH